MKDARLQQPVAKKTQGWQKTAKCQVQQCVAIALLHKITSFPGFAYSLSWGVSEPEDPKEPMEKLRIGIVMCLAGWLPIGKWTLIAPNWIGDQHFPHRHVKYSVGGFNLPLRKI